MSQSVVTKSEALAPAHVEEDFPRKTALSATNGGMDGNTLAPKPSRASPDGIQTRNTSADLSEQDSASVSLPGNLNHHDPDLAPSSAETIHIESTGIKRKPEEDELESAKKRTRTDDLTPAGEGTDSLGAFNNAFEETGAQVPDTSELGLNGTGEAHSPDNIKTYESSSIRNARNELDVDQDVDADADVDANEDADVEDADAGDADFEDEDDEDEDDDDDNDLNESASPKLSPHPRGQLKSESEEDSSRNRSQKRSSISASGSVTSPEASIKKLKAEGLNESDKDQASPESATNVNDEDDDEDESINENEEEDSDQEQRRRQAAVSLLTEIEIDFAKFRDQLQADQVARCELELELCENGTHPELEAVCESIRERRDQRVQQSQKLMDYQLRCIATQTKAARVRIHQQFLKDRFEARSELLCNTTREWYQVNIERRAADKLVPDYGYSADIANNHTEIAQLSQLAELAGFPAAPTMSTATDQELNEDLQSLGLRQ